MTEPEPVQPVAVAMIGDDDEAGADDGAGAGADDGAGDDPAGAGDDPPVQLEPMKEPEMIQPVSWSRR